MSEQKIKLLRQKRRKKRVSLKIFGTSDRPRISVYRSSRHMLVQAIDDTAHKTLVSAGDRSDKQAKGTKTDKAVLVGRQLAEKLKKIGVKTVVFDRGYNRYLGRVKAVAESMRESGINI